MAGIIERRKLTKWVLSLFEAGKTTREIESILNNPANLKEGQEPISQPTIARFLQPYREALNTERRQVVNKSFSADLEALNTLIARNQAIANGWDWDVATNAPRRHPDGTYVKRSYKVAEQIAASKIAMQAIMKKFDFLQPTDVRIYAELSGPGGTPVPIAAGQEAVAALSEECINARIEALVKRLGLNLEVALQKVKPAEAQDAA